MKRLDIQGLRAIAIILVLLFHFYPQYAPNGYVGVDIFFVISGYLMAFLLRRPKDSFIIKYVDFIYRRCKRIVPMAYLIFALTFLIMQLWFPRLAEENRYFSLKALLFYANRRSQDEAYETQLSNAEIVFTHYWSLAVEMQFYLLAPFIFWIATKAAPKRPAIPCILLAILSLAYSTSLSPTDAFNSTIARLWQFMSGYVAFFMLPEEEAPSSTRVHGDQKEYKRLLDVEVGPIKWSVIPSALRKPKGESRQPFLVTDSYLLSNRVMAFVGDISYSLYLVHWPILCFGKYLPSETTNDHILGIKEPSLFLTASVIISIALHYSFEKYYVMWSKSVTIISSTVLFCLCIALVYLPELGLDDIKPGHIPLLHGETTNDHILGIKEPSLFLTASVIISIALHYSFEKYYVMWSKSVTIISSTVLFCLCIALVYLPELGLDDIKPGHIPLLHGKYQPVFETHLKYLHSYAVMLIRGQGNLTVLIVGNSYASNQAGTIYAQLRQHASTITLLHRPACESLVQTIGNGCSKGMPTAMKFIERYPHDVLFVVERYLQMKSPIKGNLTTDPTMVQIKAQIPKLEKKMRKIFIIGAIPMVKRLSTSKAYEWLKSGKSLKTLKDVVAYDESPASKRLAQFSKLCKKCTVYDWGYLFNYNGTAENFQYYDKNTEQMYFDDWIHLNDFGKKHIRTLYEKIAREIGLLISNKTFS